MEAEALLTEAAWRCVNEDVWEVQMFVAQPKTLIVRPGPGEILGAASNLQQQPHVHDTQVLWSAKRVHSSQ